MGKKIYILLVVSILTGSAFGQFVGKDELSVSIFYLQKSELDSARKYIDLAIENEELKSVAKTWYYRGFIYKNYYKKKEKSNKFSPARLISIESFKTMLTLGIKDELKENAFKVLKYLASTLYNDAARLLSPDSYVKSMDSYEKFRSTMLLIDPKADLTNQDIRFKLALASMLNRSERSVLGLDSLKEDQIKQAYLEVLVIDSNNPDANYNLAILYYNEGVDVIHEIDYEMPLMTLNEVQTFCVEVFLKGLPYMLKSYELGYKQREALLGVSNIYYGLNDKEKSEFYKKKLELLEGKERLISLNKNLKELEAKGEKDSEDYKKQTEELEKLTEKLRCLEKE